MTGGTIRPQRRTQASQPTRTTAVALSKPDLTGGTSKAQTGTPALSAGVLSPVWLTVAEVCDELKVARSTCEKWRQKGDAPRAVRLPNGQLRVRREWLDEWIEDRLSVDAYG